MIEHLNAMGATRVKNSFFNAMVGVVVRKGLAG
jgi:hypothetical protein